MLEGGAPPMSGRPTGEFDRRRVQDQAGEVAVSRGGAVQECSVLR